MNSVLRSLLGCAALTSVTICSGQMLAIELPDGIPVDGMAVSSDGGLFVNWPMATKERVTKYSATFQELWSVELSTQMTNRFIVNAHMLPLSDGGLLLASYGGEDYGGGGSSDTNRAFLSLVRLDANGAVSVSRSFGLFELFVTSSIRPWGTGSHIMMCADQEGSVFIELQKDPDNSTWLLKLNEDLLPVWLYSTPLPLGPLTTDGQGGVFLPMQGTSVDRLLVAHLNSDGSLAWKKEYRHDDSHFAGSFAEIIVEEDGSLVLGGGDMTSAFMMKTQNNGEPLWFKLYAPSPPPNNALFMHGVKATQSGKYVMHATSTQFHYLMFLNSDGVLVNTHVAQPYAEAPWEECILMSGPIITNGDLTYTVKERQCEDQDFGFSESHAMAFRVNELEMDGCQFLPTAFNELNFPVSELLQSDGPALQLMTNYDIRDLELDVVGFEPPVMSVVCGSIGMSEVLSGDSIFNVQPRVIVAGQDLQAIMNEPGQLHLTDAIGKRVKDISVLAGIQLISTDGLLPGVYIASFSSALGRTAGALRIVVAAR